MTSESRIHLRSASSMLVFLLTCATASTIKVPDDAPPLFLLNAADDRISAAIPSLFMDWRAANRPAAIHSFVAGGHGFGMAIHYRPTDNWIELFNNSLHYE